MAATEPGFTGDEKKGGDKDKKEEKSEPAKETVTYSKINIFTGNEGDGDTVESDSLVVTENETETSYTSYSKLNFVFYFIYKYKYENRSSLEDVKSLTID
jgi:hypothetical protein